MRRAYPHISNAKVPHMVAKPWVPWLISTLSTGGFIFFTWSASKLVELKPWLIILFGVVFIVYVLSAHLLIKSRKLGNDKKSYYRTSSLVYVSLHAGMAILAGIILLVLRNNHF